MPAVKEMLAVAKRVLGYDLLQARSRLICHTAVHPGGTCKLAVKEAPHARRCNWPEAGCAHQRFSLLLFLMSLTHIPLLLPWPPVTWLGPSACSPLVMLLPLYHVAPLFLWPMVMRPCPIGSQHTLNGAAKPRAKLAGPLEDACVNVLCVVTGSRVACLPAVPPHSHGRGHGTGVPGGAPGAPGRHSDRTAGPVCGWPGEPCTMFFPAHRKLPPSKDSPHCTCHGRVARLGLATATCRACCGVKRPPRFYSMYGVNQEGGGGRAGSRSAPGRR